MAIHLQKLGSRAVLFGALFLSSLLGSSLAQSTQNSTSVPSAQFTEGNGDSQLLVSVNVPEGADKTDLYFHFEAPSNDHAWVAFGMGSRMDKSLMFVVYRSQDNQGEPTVSPRIASQHNPPEYTNAVNISVLEGSSVSDTKFVANFHCLSCRNWGDSEVDVTSSAAPFIWALGPSGDLQSDDKEAQIRQHSSYRTGSTINMKSAVGVAGVPVAGSTSTTDGSNPSNNNNDSDDGPGYVLVSRGVIFHGFIMCFAFALVYPAGYLFLRLFDRVWLHAGIQSFGLFCTVVGFGSGMAISFREQISPSLTHPHQIIGIIIFILILATWTIGLIGHRAYKRTQRPHPVMKAHRILGPLLLALAFVNACIGLAWIGATRAIIGYSIFNLLVVIVVGSLVFMKKKRKMRQSAQNSAAANNFREGATYDPATGGAPPPAYGQNVQMQTFASQGAQEHGRVEYYNVQPNK